MVSAVPHAPAASSPAGSRNGDLGALVRRAQLGDVDALAALITSHDAEVRRLAQGIVRDIDDAEDMTQEVWLRVTEKITQISEPDSFRAWVRSVARSVCLNFLRRRRTGEQATPTRDLGTDAIPLVPADEESSSPERHVLRRDDQRKLWEALGALSEDDRIVLRLRELEERGYGEIGTTLGTTAHAAEVRGSRARDRLRQQISVVDQAKVPCNANPLRLRTLVEHRSGRSAWVSGDDHVWSCPTCRQRLASMDIGRSALSGLAGLVLLPRGLMATLEHIRAAIGRVYANLCGTELVGRIPLSVPVTPALESGAPLLASSGGMAVAAAILSMAVGLGTLPADAHDADPATRAEQPLVSSTRAGLEAFVVGPREGDTVAVITLPPAEPPTSKVVPTDGAPGAAASAVPSVVPEVEEPQPAHAPASDASPSSQPTPLSSRTPVASSSSPVPAPSSPAALPSAAPSVRAAPPKGAEKASAQAKPETSRPPATPKDHAAQARGNSSVPQQEATRESAAHLDVDAASPSRARQDPSDDAKANVAHAKDGDVATSTEASAPARASTLARAASQPQNEQSDHAHAPRDVTAAAADAAGSSSTEPRGKTVTPPARKK